MARRSRYDWAANPTIGEYLLDMARKAIQAVDLSEGKVYLEEDFQHRFAANWVLHYAVDRLHMFETLSDFANLPLLVLVTTLLSFLLLPALNAYSRFNERQADRYAFQSIARVAPFISSMNKLADQNLAERAPSRWVEWFFHSHPAISKRVQAAETWAKVRAAVDADG